MVHAWSTSALGTSPPVVPHGRGSLAGIWIVTGYKTSRVSARSRVALTADGNASPLLPAAAALLEKRLAEADRGYPFPNTRSSCLPGGIPHSEDLHLLERWRRPDGNTQEVRVTLTDPKAFSSPWQTRSVYKSVPPDVEGSEYICENNRNSPDAQGHMGFQR
jgi:hypothetical protein